MKPPIIEHNGERCYESTDGLIPVSDCRCGAYHDYSCPVREHRRAARLGPSMPAAMKREAERMRGVRKMTHYISAAIQQLGTQAPWKSIIGLAREKATKAGDYRAGI